jgi:hypothetical protein
MSGLTTVLFLGGWLPPMSLSLFYIFPGAVWMALKILFILFLFVWIRAAFPRYRFDQLMHITWRIFLPLSVAGLIFITGIVYACQELPQNLPEPGGNVLLVYPVYEATQHDVEEITRQFLWEIDTCRYSWPELIHIIQSEIARRYSWFTDDSKWKILVFTIASQVPHLMTPELQEGWLYYLDAVLDTYTLDSIWYHPSRPPTQPWVDLHNSGFNPTFDVPKPPSEPAFNIPAEGGAGKSK